MEKELQKQKNYSELLIIRAYRQYSKKIIYFLTYKARTHQFDSVSTCPTQVGHRRMLDTSTTCVQHTILRVPFRKHYFLAQTRVGHNWTRLRHGQTQPSAFFPII